jgi:hypothetical protein
VPAATSIKGPKGGNSGPGVGTNGNAASIAERNQQYMDKPTGYMHPNYAFSLREFGNPRELPRCGGWILEREIPGTPYKDAMGCYPLFSCRDWFKLHEDLEEMKSDLLSLALVTDPFGGFDQAYLARWFQIVKPFKKHLIADLSQNVEHFVIKHHRYYARKSLREVQVQIYEEPARYADAWEKLYRHLIKKKNISGIRAFSKDSFRAQMETPGIILVVAKLGRDVIGGNLIVICNNLAYSHLAAFSDVAYKSHASYGIYWIALKYLKERGIRYFDLGASAGLAENAKDGLAWFKAGWSNESRTVYFCGRIFNNRRYTTICRQKNIGITDYFPAYRKGEFINPSHLQL